MSAMTAILVIRQNQKWQNRLGCCMIISLFTFGWPACLFFWFIIALLERERQICIAKRLVVVVVEKPHASCVICWSSIPNQVARLPCTHEFHNTCLTKWAVAQKKSSHKYNRLLLLPCTCPLCRQICFVKY